MNASQDLQVRAGAAGTGLDSDVARVLRNTYSLLALTLLASAGTAALAMAVSAPALPWWLTLAGFFGLFFLVSALRNSVWALPAVFALTGFMGFTLGPMLSAYLGLPGGPAMVMQAFGGTAAVFLGLVTDIMERLGPYLEPDSVDEESLVRLREAVQLIERKTASRG